ncbi:MAG TPA: cob(I)yrinic acid a,c-diamide adenosyltransferase [Candidatus Rifleibacterium sp.]|nr:cob(I)yrinic acid a,c-diamide adenosyltransferase [Candidatus Rifleibacterium sp.]HPT47361.1 cob(I)yrinic acid a,c-diamide adenosyltransferase [Candidatus Rifleibacterium sp.]
MIHAYIGDGKGKTTAAIGLMIRAFGAGRRVGVVFFDKGSETYRHNELVVLDRLGIEYHISGNERMKPDGTFRFAVIDEDITEAGRGVCLAKELIASGRFDLLVLDEALSTMTYGMLDRKSLLQLIEQTPNELELVLTGRCDDEQILEQADLVTSMVKQKHYFDKGIQARPGIEY